MLQSLDDKFQIGYEEYLKLPKATFMDLMINEMFLNGWYIQTGFSFIPPCPHRYYTLLEFVFQCGKNENLYKRFIK